jgi:hypothetical protein
MNFGVMAYDTGNLGDQIQSIAAARFLPRVDVLLQRDALDLDPDGTDCIYAILNGFFMGSPAHWPPHPRIRPLLLSMHLDTRRPSRKRPWRPSAATRMLSPMGRRWFVEHGPVGARDRATLALFQRHGVPSWHSSCLTLTLPEVTAARDDLVVACDLPEPYLGALRGRTRSDVLAVSHEDPVTIGHAARMAKAQALLDLYGRAKAVITTRLHCALPCLAIGTPVLFVPIPLDYDRQQPAFEFARVAMPAAFLLGQYHFDADFPTANPQGWRAFARTLAERCTAFSAQPRELAS